MSGGYLNISPRILKSIPVNLKINKTVISKVNKILKLKKQNPKSDTSKLENEIDKIVYKIYDLTDEEIKIIENETA